ncbi:hypothetical protein TorRG33x02_152600 [Trema orientale]|uniref:Uncharacterized protein n=1 Tax=Trema orientale TaxID=63057 RepID=A0A2P5EU13_TREOI|nr:hypothetical protein TorRG33x02_152600 [Trema orientale]
MQHKRIIVLTRKYKWALARRPFGFCGSNAFVASLNNETITPAVESRLLLKVKSRCEVELGFAGNDVGIKDLFVIIKVNSSMQSSISYSCSIKKLRTPF